MTDVLRLILVRLKQRASPAQTASRLCRLDCNAARDYDSNKCSTLILKKDVSFFE